MDFDEFEQLVLKVLFETDVPITAAHVAYLGRISVKTAERHLARMVEHGTLMVRIPLPPGIPLQMITAEDVGAVAAAAALDPDRVSGGSIEIAGDELTGEQIAEAYQHRYDVPARYEPLPIDVLGDDADQRAMFEWFAHLPAFQADFDATRALAPGTKTFEQWLATRPDL